MKKNLNFAPREQSIHFMSYGTVHNEPSSELLNLRNKLTSEKKQIVSY